MTSALACIVSFVAGLVGGYEGYLRQETFPPPLFPVLALLMTGIFSFASRLPRNFAIAALVLCALGVGMGMGWGMEEWGKAVKIPCATQ